MTRPPTPTTLTGWLPDFQRHAAAAEFFNIQTDLLAVIRENGRFFHVNPACMALLGYDEAELIDRLFAEVVAHNGMALSIEQLRQMYANGEKMLLRLIDKKREEIPVGLVAAHERSNSTYVILRPLGDTDEMCAQCGRVVEAQNIAAASQRRMRLVLEHIPIGVVILDENAHIRYMNRDMLMAIGHEPGELDGLNLFELAHPDEVKLRLDLFRLALNRPGEAIYNGVMRLRDKWQQWKRFEVSVLNLLGDAIMKSVVMYCKHIED